MNPPPLILAVVLETGEPERPFTSFMAAVNFIAERRGAGVAAADIRAELLRVKCAPPGWDFWTKTPGRGRWARARSSRGRR